MHHVNLCIQDQLSQRSLSSHDPGVQGGATAQVQVAVTSCLKKRRCEWLWILHHSSGVGLAVTQPI